MGATDLYPTRLAAAQRAADDFVDQVPKKYRIGVVSFSTRAQIAVAPTDDRDLVHAAIGSLRPGEGTAIGDAVLLSAQLGPEAADEGRRRPADLRAPDLRRRPRRRADDSAGRRPARQGAPRARLHRSARHRRAASSATRCPAATPRSIRVPPSPQTLQLIARTSGGEFFTAPTANRAARRCTTQLRSRIGHTTRVARDDGRLRGRCRAAPPRRRGALRALVQEGAVKRLAVARRGRGAALAATAAPAGATNECRGLNPCVPVAGPWVVVPAGRTRAAARRCSSSSPARRASSSAGVDAELTDRAIDVSIVGTSGSPVSPGVTTSRTVVFVASYVGAGGRRRNVPAARRLRPGERRRPADADRRRRDLPARAADRPPRAHRSRPRRDDRHRLLPRRRAPRRRVLGTRARDAAPRRRAARRRPAGGPAQRPATGVVVTARGGPDQGVVQVAAVCAGGR